MIEEVFFTFLGVILIIIGATYTLVFLVSKKREWKEWYFILIVFLVLDIISTCYFVYFLGMGWEAEKNEVVRRYGDKIGHLNALLLNHLSLASVAFLIGFCFKKIFPLIYILLYGLTIIMLAFAILINTILTTLHVYFR